MNCIPWPETLLANKYCCDGDIRYSALFPKVPVHCERGCSVSALAWELVKGKGGRKGWL